MNWQFIVQVGNRDTFSPLMKNDQEQIYIQLNKESGDNPVHHNIGEIVDRFHISLTGKALDLLNIAIAIYSADRMISRKDAYDGWSRYITLYLPVSNLSLWRKHKDNLLETVRFLTGDYWEIEFRQLVDEVGSEPHQAELPEEKRGRHLVLLSGGLDSFVGAIDILEKTNDEVIFVSHYGSGGVVKPVQDNVITFTLSRR